MNENIKYLKKTIQLAKKGLSWTNPNPLVGALIVKDNRIIGQGIHRKAGFPHAEIEALQKCKENPVGATLYINLEPCTHFGRTPPCVDAIIKSGIKRVVCSSLDPNPKVFGTGIVKLQKAGIEVSVGILEKEARTLNETFFKFYESHRSFIALKFASSLDGKIATSTGDSKWITNEKARNYARNLRSQYQAVLVGINTVLLDNPHLGVRIKGIKDPIRIILDSTLKVPLDSQVMRDKDVLIVTTKKANKKKLDALQKLGFDVIVFNEDKIEITKLLDVLKQKDIISVLVEGGGRVLRSFVASGVIDKVYAFYAPLFIGGDKSVNEVLGKGVKKIQDAIRLSNVSFKKFDDNLLTVGYYP